MLKSFFQCLPLTQDNAGIVLKGIYLASVRQPFPPSPYTSFFSFEDVSQSFSGTDQHIHTFLQAFLDRKHFPRL